MKYSLNDYYYHSISKDDKELVYTIFNAVIKDKKIKSQRLLGKTENKFNGLDYVSLAAYIENSEYNSFIISEEYFSDSKLSNLFSTYDEHLAYMKLDNELEKAISKEEFFKKNNTTNKRDYFNYLDSISRTYPVDISNLYKITNDNIYKEIIELCGSDIINCYKSGNCFDEYIRKSKGITFVFSRSIKVNNVTIIPNLPSNIESKLVEKMNNSNIRYSNQLGEVQVKDYLDITQAVGLILADDIDINYIKKIITENNIKYLLFKIEDEKLVVID